MQGTKNCAVPPVVEPEPEPVIVEQPKQPEPQPVVEPTRDRPKNGRKGFGRIFGSLADTFGKTLFDDEEEIKK